MKDQDVYDLAGKVLRGVTDDQTRRYTKLGGELSLSWSTIGVGASASSQSQANEPPKHQITFSYGFILQIWKDCEGLCGLIASIPDHSPEAELYDFFGGWRLPQNVEHESKVMNMFVATITWVFFMSSVTFSKNTDSFETNSVRQKGLPKLRPI